MFTHIVLAKPGFNLLFDNSSFSMKLPYFKILNTEAGDENIDQEFFPEDDNGGRFYRNN